MCVEPFGRLFARTGGCRNEFNATELGEEKSWFIGWGKFTYNVNIMLNCGGWNPGEFSPLLDFHRCSIPSVFASYFSWYCPIFSFIQIYITFLFIKMYHFGKLFRKKNMRNFSTLTKENIEDIKEFLLPEVRNRHSEAPAKKRNI